jgi:two-component system, OmpR family, response regulator
MSPIRVLLVDDEEEFTAGLSKVLRRRGFEVAVAGDADSALRLIRIERFDVVLQDVKMPGKDGIQLLGEFQVVSPTTPVILMSGHMSVTEEERGRDKGAFAYLLKPHPIPELVSLIQEAAQQARSQPGGQGE